MKLKYLYDIAKTMFVATGSGGSFDIKVRVTGDLVGRAVRLTLLPLSFHEYVVWENPSLAGKHGQLLSETLQIRKS